MEVDSNGKVFIIDSTFKKLFPTDIPKLNKSPYEIRNYNKKIVQLVGQCPVPVQHSSFKGELRILIVKDQRESILGVNWFQPLGLV